MKSRPQRTAAAAAIALACALGLAPVALGASDHWFSGGLAYQFGYASSAAHSISYVQGNASADEFCIGAEAGTAGSYYDAPSYSDCAAYSSGGAASVYFTPTCCFHATIVNGGPYSSITVNSATHYDY